MTYTEASRHESFTAWLSINSDAMRDFYDYYADDCVADDSPDSLEGFGNSLAFMWSELQA